MSLPSCIPSLDYYRLILYSYREGMFLEDRELGHKKQHSRTLMLSEQRMGRLVR
jgi:hypothetical protein